MPGNRMNWELSEERLNAALEWHREQEHNDNEEEK